MEIGTVNYIRFDDTGELRIIKNFRKIIKGFL